MQLDNSYNRQEPALRQNSQNLQPCKMGPNVAQVLGKPRRTCLLVQELPQRQHIVLHGRHEDVGRLQLHILRTVQHYPSHNLTGDKGVERAYVSRAEQSVLCGDVAVAMRAHQV